MPEKLNKRTNASRHTILSRIMLPGMAVILVQSILYMLIFWQYSIIGRIENNAYDIFSEKVLNRQQDLQSDILYKCMTLDNDSEYLLQKIYDSLAQKGADIADISISPTLNRQIVADVSDYIIAILHRNMVNGVFLVLDGPATNAASQGALSRAGLYIRQFDSLGNAPDNSDLLMERGMPDLARGLGIALDRYWSAGFTFSDETACAVAVFLCTAEGCQSAHRRTKRRFRLLERALFTQR
ncbi:hypothetical protein DSECCO2_555000 [anaerobic digester metagenome]